MKIIHQPDMQKAAVWAVIFNVLQIAAILALLVCALFFSGSFSFSGKTGVVLLAITAFIISLGAVLDIREALRVFRLDRRVSGLSETVDEISDLNKELRSQRHDFLNHLQVVYSLIEMEEYDEARAYMNRVYGDIKSLSGVMRTACVPLNALMRVKLAQCEEKGIRTRMEVSSAWDQLPVEEWEICRVLSNLIDNAMDALTGDKRAAGEPFLAISIGEDIGSYTFSVTNNGPDIPADFMESMFSAGVSSKGEGRGMGLYICRDILQKAGGDLTCVSGSGTTCFTGTFSKKPAALKEPD
ncbi:MAG: hypothetical protein CW338_06620 [Clostridiales bacterium]|nr:hypothetical protein [Clostridiales bacterium]